MENLNFLKRQGIKFIEAGFLDLHGILRTRTFPVEKIDKLTSEGYGFDGYSVGYSNIEDSDLLARIDPATLHIYEIDNIKIAFFLCDLYKDEKPLEIYPRYVLKKIEKEISYRVLVGPELEFYIIKDNGSKDNGFYMASHPEDEDELLKRKLVLELNRLGIDVELMHHEVGPRQHEIILPAMSPLEMADLTVFYKKYLKTFFSQYGYKVTFMPKPFEGLAGNGMHVHLSLWKNSRNIFYNDGLSDEAKYFIGGLLKYAPNIAVYTNPTVNSYKRLVPGFEAPVYLLWDWGNRSVLVRVPKYRKINPKNARIEYRAPDASGNIYLTFASIINAGVKGLKEKIDPGDSFNDNAYKPENQGKLKTLPSTLFKAIEYSKNVDFFDEKLKNRYLNLKIKEWKEYEDYISKNGLTLDTLTVTEWEIAKYFYR